jgi:hypothetical protein
MLCKVLLFTGLTANKAVVAAYAGTPARALALVAIPQPVLVK